MAKNTKKTVKIQKPDFIVDITDATCPADVYLAFAEAKIDKFVTIPELVEFLNTYGTTIICCDDCADCSHACKHADTGEKPGMFKRFWNWLTNKH